ncbi:riboflavin kinase isoform X3 [Equus asinus]|uniref:riboflavin kinase isoform X3 n=1 Tax=Equus asinus TaxID=9793 RepID=UPI0038F6ACD1
MRHLPYFCRGEVVRGFGRGSKQLGIPTANFPEQVVDNLPADLSTGIYYGWASVGSGDVHKMVVSIGWNPYYKNTKKSMGHILVQPQHLLYLFALFIDFLPFGLRKLISCTPSKRTSMGKSSTWPSLATSDQKGTSIL